MFSKNIARTDTFLDMPPSVQNLYFHLGIEADDDGFVSPKMVMRLVGSTSDELKILIAKGFAIPFEDGVIVITHWKVNNEIRQDRYKETQYLNHKSKLSLNKGIYSTGVPLVVPSGDNLDTQVRLGKDSIGKENTISSASADTPSAFDTFWDAYPKKENKKKSKEIWQRKKLDSKLPEILAFVEKAKKTDRWVEGYIKHPTGFLNGELWTDDLTLYNNRKGAPMQITKIG